MDGETLQLGIDDEVFDIQRVYADWNSEASIVRVCPY